ncbi:MAG: hypothetical protein HZA93_10260 [Verrucomicrobia bacterium]|nr:hypothetical protein [Verrucomicrobiota bacterium]
MKFPTFALLAWLVVTPLLAVQDVEVALVRFSPNVRAASGANWFEADVQLEVKPPASAPGRMISRVRVAIFLQFELPAAAGAERRSEFYRAEAECVALEAGRADVRFYLPPEIVKRDQLHADPRWWGVEVAVASKPVPAGKGAYSATLTAADSRKNFLTRAAAAAAPNDGLLQPQFLTPFVHDYPRATPTFVRREAR